MIGRGAAAMMLLVGLPVTAGDVSRAIDTAARRHGLPPELVWAVARVESSLDPSAVSPKGATGLMQLMPQTAKRFGVTDPLDPEQSLEGGCAYLAWLRERFDGDAVLMLSAYNAGEGAVERHQGVPPYPETELYVRKVLTAWAKRRQGDSGVASPVVPNDKPMATRMRATRMAQFAPTSPVVDAP